MNESSTLAPVVPETVVPVTRSKRRSRWLLVGLPVLGATLLLFAHFARGASVAMPALPKDDTPRVDGRRIVFSERYAKRIGLKTAEIKDTSLVPSVSVVGSVTFNPEYVSEVGTRLRGLVREVYRFEGATVKQGEVLAQIDSPELGEAQAAVTSLMAQTVAAHRNAQREKDLRAQRLTTLKESEDAAAAVETYDAMLAAARQKVTALAGRSSAVTTQQLGFHQLVSPLTGTIVERHISKGQLVDGAFSAFLIANLDHLWVELSVFERSLPHIRKGDQVELRALGSTEAPIVGRVAQIADTLDESNKSAVVRVEVDNRERKLRPGQAIDATIHVSGAAVTSGLVVAPAAVTFVDGKPTVFVADSPLSVVPTEVVLGVSGSQGQQIVEGLRAGQQIVTEGTFELKSELFR
jgi:cobalt-zinc-cadmium efflux system membrane fusion protein